MANAERLLLLAMRESQDHGAFSMACDGKECRALAHSLEQAGLAEWKGETWGSQFWAITDAGRALLASPAEERG